MSYSVVGQHGREMMCISNKFYFFYICRYVLESVLQDGESRRTLALFGSLNC
jgi:hypothetical protein